MQKLVYLKIDKIGDDYEPTITTMLLCFLPKRANRLSSTALVFGRCSSLFFAAICLMLIIWQDFDPRVFVFFAAALGFAEIFVLLRRRLSVPCPHCGFDAVLYKSSQSLAAGKVKMHMERRKTEPLSLLAPPPHLPVVIKKKNVKTDLNSPQP